MEGRAFGVFWEVVERHRARLAELEGELKSRDRAYTEAWFRVMAMGSEGATADDKAEARAELVSANAALAAAERELEKAKRRLPLYEQALRQFTPT